MKMNQKNILRLWVTLLLSAIAFFANSSESYNYSSFNTGFGYNSHNKGVQKIDGTTWFINGAYHIPSTPLILTGGYSHGRIDKNEIASNIGINDSSYFAGASLLLRPTAKLHFVPSLTYGRLRSGLSIDTTTMKGEVTAYSASINARYHLERGLWLNTGYTQQYFDQDSAQNNGFFLAGAEYQVDTNWGFGMNYRGNSEEYTTQLFIKLFY
ncbi:autotransporter outer membrane beta-barrel domain-containing protein [Endozoicomonas sp.]|uniref:autotransporter outer membrane beta-barrel domain-containing protein n=1 Tax=Endozoicomonas sp. TaxID=1892382 RepID=UPI003AF91E83